MTTTTEPPITIPGIPSGSPWCLNLPSACTETTTVMVGEPPTLPTTGNGETVGFASSLVLLGLVFIYCARRPRNKW